MSKKGLLIDYNYCTGCHTCEVACKQEHNWPVGSWGIKVTEYIQTLPNNKVAIDYLPFPSDLCNLCYHRTSKGDLPACVKHCQADCMQFGELSELVMVMEEKSKVVLFSPQ